MSSVGAEEEKEGGERWAAGHHQRDSSIKCATLFSDGQTDGQDLVFVLLTNQQMFNLKMCQHS